MSNLISAIKVLIQKNYASWERHNHNWWETNCEYYKWAKDSNSDFFHDHISLKKIKEIYSEIVPNSFSFEPVTKDDIKMKYRNSM